MNSVLFGRKLGLDRSVAASSLLDSPISRRLSGSDSDQMDGEASERQPKQERLRTRWTASLDKIFADLVVEQIQLGNRPNNVFDKKTWNHVRDEFNKQTDLNFNNNQLRKHLDVLRTRYHNVKSSFDQNDFVIDDSCCIGFDLWEDIGAQTKPETTKIKECPIYEQLCTIFADSGADGKYAQSSHFEELDKSTGTDPAKLNSYLESGTPRAETPSSSKFAQGNVFSAQNPSKNVAERKRKRGSEMGSVSGQTKRDHEINEAMAEAMLEMLAASQLREVAMPKQEDRFAITNCIKALDEIEEMEGIDSHLYFTALDLFEDPNVRETFVSLKSNQLQDLVYVIVVGCYLEDKVHSGQMLLCELVHNYTNFGTKLAEPRLNK